MFLTFSLRCVSDPRGVEQLGLVGRRNWDAKRKPEKRGSKRCRRIGVRGGLGLLKGGGRTGGDSSHKV